MGLQLVDSVTYPAGAVHVSLYRFSRNSATGPPRIAPITRPAVAQAMVSSMMP